MPRNGFLAVSKILTTLFILPVAAFGADAPIPTKPEYNRDVRPILADACFRCHGFDKNTREGDRRLDTREGAMADNGGIQAVVPGKLKESDLHERIHTGDEDDMMPPKKAHRQLTEREKAIIDRWIEQGAEYQEHWAYIPPAKPAVPTAKEKAGSAIDAFIFARQEQLGLKRAAEADRATLARRLYLDLLGLPPRPGEVEAFVNDGAPDAFERLVDRLLASPHFGERLAVWWLDLVRYADTVGYHGDVGRNVSPYRDYVIRAFNDGMPFDRFTIEQLAGDLLPNSTQSQKVASGYNRLILSTEEGGAQAKEYEAKHVTDRVKSVGTTWLAQTYMCAECHDHKYDPVTARDFYALGAFFADIKEQSIGKREPGMKLPSEEQEAELKAFETKIAALTEKFEGPLPEFDAAQLAWEKEISDDPRDKPWATLLARKVTVISQVPTRSGDAIEVPVAPTASIYEIEVTLPAGATGVQLEVLPSPSLPAGGPGRSSNGNFVLNEFALLQGDKALKIGAASATFEQSGFPARHTIDGITEGMENGWGVSGNSGKHATIFFELAEPLPEATSVIARLSQNWGSNHAIGRFRLGATTEPGRVRMPTSTVPADIVAAIKKPAKERNSETQRKVTAHFRSIAPEFAPMRQSLAGEKSSRDALLASLPQCLVSESMPTPRVVRVLPRGDWTKKDGEIMEPATPGYLPGAPKAEEGKRLTRLDLAKWLVSRENPLTARVFVNRMWKLFYGTGLSKTLEDMGTQGELPMNQPLLDWMAMEFMDSGWNVKHMAKLMVTSASYRLASAGPKEMTTRDPMNRELARGGRWRLDAEFVRDNALSIAGLMVHQVGGPSVKPYQPAGYWENLNFPVREWENDKNSNQWRRGLYTWWQRSYLHPSLLAFDAPTREECAADRPRSNIPQQALALLNDTTYVEAARALAARMLREGGVSPAEKVSWAFRQATGRKPSDAEQKILVDLYERHITVYTRDTDAAQKLIASGISSVPQENGPSEVAAWTSVARAILNLHETITRL